MISRSAATTLGFGLRADVAQLVEHLHGKEVLRVPTLSMDIQQYQDSLRLHLGTCRAAGAAQGRFGAFGAEGLG
jgi:hypothetical protein